MSENNLINKSTQSSIPRISSFDNCVFNSKLFIDLDSTYEQSLNNSYTKESENLPELDDSNFNNGCFLIKELIEELDSPKLDSLIEESGENKENKANKSLLSLVNNGYEFLPKGYRNSLDQNSNNKVPKMFNKYNIKISDNLNKNNFYPTKHKSIKERKGDWFCQLCLNLNFAFRTKWNRCKAPKEECMQKMVK